LTEIDVNSDTLAYETVVNADVGGSFVGKDHTLRWLRSGEHYYGGTFNRGGKPGDEHSMLARAHEQVLDILSQPLSFRAPPAAVERIKTYVQDEARSSGVAVPEWAS
jgi:trimethylamine:corrinoid methyltransferase-like protein